MSEHDLILGERDVWGGTQPFLLTAADRRRHLYLLGQTGTGKSTLLRELVAQDIAAGAGCALIDPHGDLAADVLERVPPWRIDDVLLIDPSDREQPVGVNPFFGVPRDERALVAANLVATFHSLWRESWGPRLEYILFHTIRALLDVRTRQLRPTLAAIPRLLVDDRYCARVVAEIEDIETRRFFTEEFQRWNERQRSEYLGSTLNKVGQFLTSPALRNIVGQWQPRVDLAAAMAAQQIIIVRVPKGVLGEAPANLFGSLLATTLLQVAMRRAALPADERPDYHLYIDEFQNFTTDSFASVFSEARKYGLTLTVAHQYLDQLSESVRSAVFGNVGTLVAFRTGGGDAEHLSREIGKYVPSVFRDLRRGRVCVRLLTGGETLDPFLGTTVPDDMPYYGRGATITDQSRQRYGVPRATVEARLAEWV